MNQKETIANLSEMLKSKTKHRLNMIIGLDGFVDEIVHAVDKRQDFETFSRITKISDFGQRIVNAAGLSTNIELVTTHTKLGGNGPIMSNALIEYGARLTYIGAIGVPDIHPVFKDMAGKSEAVYSLCDPGHTDALEFDDGKLMLGKITLLNAITWQRFKDIVGDAPQIAEMMGKADLFGMENWTMVPYMSQIWEGLIKEVLPLMPKKEILPLAFFDLADPEKRTDADIRHAMGLIKAFSLSYRAVLGLNEKELYEIAHVCGIIEDQSLSREDMLKKLTAETYEKLGIYCLVVHPTKEAMACINGEYCRVCGPYCEKPVLTTGAGDNFNAGFCFGLALGLDLVNSLTLGVATSGYYVRNAKSPAIENIISFLKDWENGSL